MDEKGRGSTMKESTISCSEIAEAKSGPDSPFIKFTRFWELYERDIKETGRRSKDGITSASDKAPYKTVILNFLMRQDG